MKAKLLVKTLLFTFISLIVTQTNAQIADKNVKEKIMDERGKPSLIIFNENTSYKASENQKVLKEQLLLKETSSFAKVKTEIDKLGITHDKYQLFYQGIKVEFATYTLHSKSDKLESMSGEFYELDKINIRPVLSKEQAFNNALKQIGAFSYLWENPSDAKINEYQKPIGELVLLPIVDEDNNGKKIEQIRLCYKYDIYATNPVSRGDIYIDAVTGQSLFYNATIKHIDKYSTISNSKTAKNKTMATTLAIANADTRYSGAKSIETTLSGGTNILADATRGSGIMTYNMKKGTSYTAAVNFTDLDNNWTATEYNNANKDNGALDAHWGAEKTYDYWSTIHGRNSYNNAGAAIKSYVHYSSSYNNAYWNGSVMTYGDGSGTGGFDILTSIDVAGHEIGHAVCSSTANLAYQLESGALNESLSDIWGACIEYYAAPSKQRWLIGEDIERRAGHLSLRSMSNPKVEGQPDTYGGTNWKTVTRCRPTSNNDYCGVHTNSGVLNHWFYILTEGKTGTNDKGSSYSITGIGIDKAAKITYRMESVYMTSGSTYANARTYAIKSSTDLYGATSPETIATTNAFYAVGVGTAYVSTAKISSPKTKTASINESIIIYPNPTNSILSVSIKDNKGGDYKIYNSLGIEIQKGKTSGGDINVSLLSKGIYFFEFNNGEKTTVKTFAKN